MRINGQVTVHVPAQLLAGGASKDNGEKKRKVAIVVATSVP